MSDEVDARLDGDAAAADDGGSQELGGSGTGPRGDDETVSADDLTELQEEPTAGGAHRLMPGGRVRGILASRARP